MIFGNLGCLRKIFFKKGDDFILLKTLLERQQSNNKIAIKSGEKEISFMTWHSHSKELSKTINRIDFDGNVSIFLPNSIEYAVAYFSVLFSDKIIVPIGTQSKELEIISTLEYCEIDLVITSLQYKGLLKQCLSRYKHKIILILVENQSIEIINDKKNFVNKSNAVVNIGNDDDVAVMLHTSGTTSNPKRVMLTHKNLVSNIESNIQSLQLTENDKVLIAMPMYFGYCNTAQFLTHLYLGASMVILKSLFLPKIFFKIVQDERITNFTGVPSMLLMILEYRYINKYDISSLRYICFGGGKMPIEQLQKLIKTLKTVGFVQTYGQTEASPRATALLPEDALRKIGSVGLPIPNVKVKIINELGEKLSNNEIGEIAIQGKNIMKGYYKQDAITKETIVDDWLHTGDLGYLDDEGYLYLTGRKKNIIISGGINIYPEEIEEVLMSHPAIKEVCVVSEEHALLGEVPVAKIIVTNIATPENYRAFCEDKLADYKIPVRFDVVENLDRTYNGKIKRF